MCDEMKWKQKIWANAHETYMWQHELILYTSCLGLSPVISAKFHLLNVHCSVKSQKNALKTCYFWFQGRSRLSILVPLESSSAVLVMICSKSVSICNHFDARLVNSSKNLVFWRGYPNLMRSYGRILEPRWLKLTLLKCTFNAENFIPRFSWSISSDFGAVQSWNVCGSLKSQKILKKPLFLGFKVVQGHQCWYPRKGHHLYLLW